MSSPELPDENPFKSPVAASTEASGERKHRGRRIIVLVLSLLVIPPAVIVAFFTACFTAGGALQSMGVGVLAGIAAGVFVLWYLCRIANSYWNREY